MKKRAIVLLADGFEEIEAITCIDILRRANVKVTITGVGKKIVKGAHDIRVEPDIEISSYKDMPDAVVLPGGMPGVNNLASSRKVNDFIKKLYDKGKIVAAICAAPSYVLAPLGILKGRKATCYPGCEVLLKGRAEVVDERVVVDGNVITSKGPGTALEFALKIAERLVGRVAAEDVRKKTLYEFTR